MKNNPSKQKKVIKYTLIFIVFCFYFICCYYTFEVVKAKIQTESKVKAAMNSDQIDITANDLSQIQIDILLAVEDPNFYGHNGVDLKTPGAGMTTITQGIVKKLYFKDFKQGIAKIKQSFIALFALDPQVSKDDQLTLFINLMGFGNDVYGLQDASQYYYNKDVSQLSEDEYISLVACIIAPASYNPKDNPEANKERSNRIKDLLSGNYTPKDAWDIYYGEEKNALSF
jgi:membrane peptidoglycan carboxypeptidase